MFRLQGTSFEKILLVDYRCFAKSNDFVSFGETETKGTTFPVSAFVSVKKRKYYNILGSSMPGIVV